MTHLLEKLTNYLDTDKVVSVVLGKSNGNTLASTAFIEHNSYEVIFYLDTINKVAECIGIQTTVTKVVAHELAHVLEHKAYGVFSHSNKWLDINNHLINKIKEHI